MAERGARAARPRRPRPAATPPADAPPVRALRGLLRGIDVAGCEALRGFFSAPRWWLLGDGAAVRARSGTAPPAAFAIDAEGARLRLQVDGPATAGHDAARLRWSDHAGRSRVLAWSLAHETTLRRLSEWLGMSLLPSLEGDAGEDPAQDAATFWLEVRIDDPPPVDDDEADQPPPHVIARLRLPLAWLPGIAARAEPAHEDDPAPGAGRWRALQSTVHVLFPVTLAMRDWRALRQGDVIVAGHRSQPPACVARAGGRDWPLAPAPGGWTVGGPSTPAPTYHEDSPMTQQDHDGTPSEASAAPASDPARSLPVQVEFELGRTEMSIGELADLQPGYVFPLATPLEGASVTIRANGRIAGRGELVAVGETLGVRLLSWS
ncbi:type III secretion system cytoplasmic ring protein SctQ [Luteimonas sp. MC1895]|uniref:type III secretion system cytoplasmic ring protein SctQ n=1 Tax=Luteimonas sp. MC1895 TaxID=2819513 RepID=UPI0018F0E3F3|nr:type III secretion system cytoplasmic ring protein SctQ [Luteimonas sp. MC1895]MBJ6979143.1 type III secretion system cytoplasmic ring protein SctQ [Luteimonas sp. MC1895]